MNTTQIVNFEKMSQETGIPIEDLQKVSNRGRKKGIVVNIDEFDSIVEINKVFNTFKYKSVKVELLEKWNELALRDLETATTINDFRRVYENSASKSIVKQSAADNWDKLVLEKISQETDVLIISEIYHNEARPFSVATSTIIKKWDSLSRKQLKFAQSFDDYRRIYLGSREKSMVRSFIIIKWDKFTKKQFNIASELSEIGNIFYGAPDDSEIRVIAYEKWIAVFTEKIQDFSTLSPEDQIAFNTSLAPYSDLKKVAKDRINVFSMNTLLSLATTSQEVKNVYMSAEQYPDIQNIALEKWDELCLLEIDQFTTINEIRNFLKTIPYGSILRTKLFKEKIFEKVLSLVNLITENKVSNLGDLATILPFDFLIEISFSIKELILFCSTKENARLLFFSEYLKDSKELKFLLIERWDDLLSFDEMLDYCKDFSIFNTGSTPTKLRSVLLPKFSSICNTSVEIFLVLETLSEHIYKDAYRCINASWFSKINTAKWNSILKKDVLKIETLVDLQKLFILVANNESLVQFYNYDIFYERFISLVEKEQLDFSLSFKWVTFYEGVHFHQGNYTVRCFIQKKLHSLFIDEVNKSTTIQQAGQIFKRFTAINSMGPLKNYNNTFSLIWTKISSLCAERLEKSKSIDELRIVYGDYINISKNTTSVLRKWLSLCTTKEQLEELYKLTERGTLINDTILNKMSEFYLE